MQDSQLPHRHHDDAVKVPARDNWKERAARMNPSVDEGPIGVDRANGQGMFGPYGSETWSTKDATVDQILPIAELNHKVGLAARRGWLDRSFVRLRVWSEMGSFGKARRSVRVSGGTRSEKRRGM